MRFFLFYAYLCAQIMSLFVFNPEHDLALAADLSNFTAPHAGRQLRADLGYIPALWAGGDDHVLVDNVEDAERRYRILMRRPFGRFITKEDIRKQQPKGVDAWGWDRAIRSFLMRYGVDAGVMPSDETLDAIRELSHRRHAVDLLSQLQLPGTIGCSYVAHSLLEIQEKLDEFGHIVVKAPWSSSGRGVRFVEGELTGHYTGWILHIIERQGSVIVEPYYNKVKDFGMEFESNGTGNVRYLGLSLFQTKNGAYTGNVVASEEEKQESISRYIPACLINDVQTKICSVLGTYYKEKYKGPFGVDMMIVARPDGHGFLLHPCVEINLRRTMGHVALAIHRLTQKHSVMQITLTDKYRIKLLKQ